MKKFQILVFASVIVSNCAFSQISQLKGQDVVTSTEISGLIKANPQLGDPVILGNYRRCRNAGGTIAGCLLGTSKVIPRSH